MIRIYYLSVLSPNVIHNLSQDPDIPFLVVVVRGELCILNLSVVICEKNGVRENICEF